MAKISGIHSKAPGTNFVNATSTIGTSGWGGLGTPTIVGYYWRRVADSIEVEVHILTGTVSSALATVPLPSGIAIDTTKINATNNTSASPCVGVFTANGTNQFGYMLACTTSSTSLVYVGPYPGAATGSMQPQTGSSTVASASNITFKFTVPVSSWSSNDILRVSNDTKV